jgi:hypothetical protein
MIRLAVIAIAAIWLQTKEYFWRSPIAKARFQTVTDFGGLEQAAALSPDGHFVAFLSDRDGQTDVWGTQVGSGEFHNLTHGTVTELANPSIRALGFSPDASLVTFWVRNLPRALVVKEGGESLLGLNPIVEDWGAWRHRDHRPHSGCVVDCKPSATHRL